MSAGINIVGSFTGSSGTAYAAHAVIEALRRGGIPIAGFALPHDRQGRSAMPAPLIPMVQRVDDLPYEHTLILDILPAVRDCFIFREDLFKRHKVGTVFFFELAGVPMDWRLLLRNLHTVFTPSRFIQESVERCVMRKATPIPLVPLLDRQPQSFARYNRPFNVLCSYDPLSAEERKNPWAAVQAFASAFAPHENARLTLKIWKNDKIVTDELARQTIVNVHPNISIIDADLQYSEHLDLVEQSDCYISLHRSEGLGLGMLEAMALARPVIATDYSGNRDYLDHSSGFPIPYRMIPVESIRYMFNPIMLGEQGHWADADIPSAAHALRALATTPNLLEAIGLQGYRKYAERRDALLSLTWLETFFNPNRTHATTHIMTLPSTAVSGVARSTESAVTTSSTSSESPAPSELSPATSSKARQKVPVVKEDVPAKKSSPARRGASKSPAKAKRTTTRTAIKGTKKR